MLWHHPSWAASGTNKGELDLQTEGSNFSLGYTLGLHQRSTCKSLVQPHDGTKPTGRRLLDRLPDLPSGWIQMTVHSRSLRTVVSLRDDVVASISTTGIGPICGFHNKVTPWHCHVARSGCFPVFHTNVTRPLSRIRPMMAAAIGVGRPYGVHAANS